MSNRFPLRGLGGVKEEPTLRYYYKHNEEPYYWNTKNIYFTAYAFCDDSHKTAFFFCVKTGVAFLRQPDLLQSDFQWKARDVADFLFMRVTTDAKCLGGGKRAGKPVEIGNITFPGICGRFYFDQREG